MNVAPNEIINKVTNSDLVVIDLADFYPNLNDILELDLKKYLFMELILKEKDFREQLKNEDFSIYKNKYVSVYCSVDTILPQWATMLLSSYLKPVAIDFIFNNSIKGASHDITLFVTKNIFKNLNPLQYENKRVMIKGCGDIKISDNAFMLASDLLLPFVKTLMYGEPCGAVPIFKRKN